MNPYYDHSDAPPWLRENPDPLRPIDTDQQDWTDASKQAIGIYLVAALLAVFAVLVGVVAVVIGGRDDE